MKCTIVKAESMGDWWVLEREVHDGRHWLEPIEGGASLMYSGRIGNADIEGDSDEWRAIADAIETGKSVSFKRCCAQTFPEGRVALCSPRNSTGETSISAEDAKHLAAEIRRKLMSETAETGSPA